MDILHNIDEIRSKIDAINKDVEIVAASKTRNIEEIRLALSSGVIKTAGENRVQELTAKYASDVTWDFIGQLQTNKVKYIIDKVRLIHGVDRAELAAVIDKEAAKHGKIQDVLIEINSGREESKGGIFISELDKLTDEISKYGRIRIRGLMAVAPICSEEGELRRLFDSVYDAFAVRKEGVFNVLSMGMSNDYLTAVKCGANMVRIGRGIFGERSYLQQI